MPLGRPAAGRRRARPLRRPGAGRRRDRRRRGRARRVDDHRRVPPGAPRRPATGWWPARSSTDSAIRVRVEAVGDDTALAGIQRLVAEAQAVAQPGAGAGRPLRRPALLRGRRRRRGHVRRLVGCSATSTTPSSAPSPCWSSPARTPSAWPSRWSSRCRRAVAARAGILVKDRLALERMRTVDAVLFDKTGTLTRGAHVVTGVAAADGLDRRRGAAAGRRRSRPTASTRWPGPSSPPPASAAPSPTADGFRSLTGRGVEATVDGDARTRSAVRRCCGSAASTEPADARRAGRRRGRRGARPCSTSCADDEVVGALALEDEVRPEAREAVAELQAARRAGS